MAGSLNRPVEIDKAYDKARDKVYPYPQIVLSKCSRTDMIAPLRMKATVLLIDDDPVDVKPLQMLLEEWDLDAITTRSGEEAGAVVELQ